MGFCLFNSIAIAACYAQQEFGLERVAVVDFDVHHGNGTQAAFWDEPSLLYASTHQMPLYPGTGAASERGANGQNIVNVQTEDFAWITRQLLTVAQECCEGRLASILEGGYDLQALGESAAAHVSELMSPAG